MAEAKNHEIAIEVATQYMPEQSDPEAERYFFTYTIKVANVGTMAVQLVSRHWIITDAAGKVEEVRGLGVVGHQPTLKPGESFEYTSGCPLATPVGTMKGSYQMVAEDGTRFDALIAEFVLAMPRTLH